ncbi:hypothetical protein F5B21DRAFT_520109 [Xylaria acuta]|nr:hypothetical protein F5B21DRAFT_520109 [Xylaria acuta]
MSPKSPDEIIDVAPITPQPYTQFHLAAVAFSHPPSPRSIKQCTCEGNQLPDKPVQQTQHIRIYYAEPSYYDHTYGCFLIKENRFSDAQGWYAPSDGLVADDAVAGSAVAAIGWWHSSEDGLSFNDPWETRVYYVDKSGNIRERINYSHFDPTPNDDFDSELPKPEELVPPTPGWRFTPQGDKAPVEGTVNSFPIVTPLPVTKLAAVRTDKGEIYLFYQDNDLTIKVLVSAPGKGWVQQETVAVGRGKAVAGTSLAVAAGGWSEVRLFYVTPQNTLGEVYEHDGAQWTQTQLPLYKVVPTAMLSAVAWNYATPFFQIRVYVTGGKDEIQEYSFSRNTTSWSPAEQADSGSKTDNLSVAIYPVSAVAAVMVGDGCSTKVYFHPRRFVAEWDSCTRATFPTTITTVSERFKVRREIEQETRVKIAEEAERKRREEEERLRKEEEERLLKEEEERKRREEERRQQEKRKQEEEQRQIEERKRLEEESKRNNLPVLSANDLQFKEMLKGKEVGDKVQIPKGAVLEKIRKLTRCQMGYEWVKYGDGWRCASGQHHLTNEQFEAL